MKYEGKFNNIPIYSDPNVPLNIMYLINPEFQLEKPKRKDGKPDMRYKVNKLEKMFEEAITMGKSS